MDKQTEQKLLEIVRKNYEEIAEDFSETRKELWPELLKLAEGVKDGDAVLDAGCGNGRLAEAFKNKKINYVGVDGSEKLIDIARKKFSIFNFQFINESIFNLDKIIEKKFDWVFSIAVLHHIPGEYLRIKALEQLKNKMKDDGKIVLTVWNLWSQGKFRKLIVKFWLLKLIGRDKMDFGDILFKGFNRESERYYHAFRKCELKKVIKKARLKIEKIYKDKYNYYVIASRAALSRRWRDGTPVTPGHSTG